MHAAKFAHNKPSVCLERLEERLLLSGQDVGFHLLQPQAVDYSITIDESSTGEINILTRKDNWATTDRRRVIETTQGDR